MKKNIILIIVAFAMFMETVDTTVLNTAIPAVARSMQVNPISLKLALISYLLSLAIFIPISGWLADKFGVKKIFMWAIVIFTLSSIWCGFTYSLTQLVIGRILQGVGGALTLPIGRLIVVRTYKRNELISKMTVVVMIGAMGMMLGPMIGGIITTHLSWHWIFWINAPIGLIALIMSWYFLPLMPARPVHRLDILGFVLFGSGLAALTLGLSAISEAAVSTRDSFLIIGFSIILLAWYIVHSKGKPHPIVKIDLVQKRTFRVSVFGNLFARLGFGGVPFLVPLLLQIPMEYSPQSSGFLLAPVALGVLLSKPLVLSILRVLGYKYLLIVNTTLVSFSLVSFTFVTQHSSIYFIGCLTFIYGFLMALQYTAINSLAYANIEQEDVSAATSIMSTVQQVAQSFGVAIAALIVSLYSGNYTGHGSLTVTNFHYTFVTLGLVTLLSIVLFFQMKPEDGQELIGVREME